MCHYGEGVFIYTGLSFFRQLPAGVPGAYRLFANLLAAGQKTQSSAGRPRRGYPFSCGGLAAGGIPAPFALL